MSRFTYEIKTQGSKKTLVVYDNEKQIYASNPTFTATDDQLLAEAKAQLTPNYGQGINQITQVPSKNSNTSSNPLTNKNIDKNSETIKKAQDRQKLKNDELKKEASQKKKVLIKEARSSLKSAKNKAISLLGPILLSFIASSVSINFIIDSLIRNTKKKVKNKGILEINDLTLIFTPLDVKSNFISYKKQFDSKVDRLKKIVRILKTIITTLRNILRIINIIITVLLIFIRIKTIVRKVQLKISSADLASPIQSKPAAAINLPLIIASISKLEEAKKKIEMWRDALRTASIFIRIFSRSINELSNKLNKLKFIINLPPNSSIPSGTSSSSEGSSTSTISEQNDASTYSGLVNDTAPETEEYLGADGRSYILVLKVLPNGFRQYQALDSFSKFKISQTAPSKAKSDQELLDEIKSILG